MGSIAHLASSSGRTGFLQELEVVKGGREVIIKDDIYGTHTVTEPVLVEILKCSKALWRLASIHQAGITGFLGIAPGRVTRFEHSVGAFLLVRIVGASIEEQLAALLHDISHTAFSHVVDYALLPPGEASFHEVHKMRYVRATEIPIILDKHGFFDLRPLDEHLFPLVEQPSPRLCADRLDYGLRDALAFGKLNLEQAQKIIKSLRAHPDADTPRRILVMEDEEDAIILARAYMATDAAVWSNPAHLEVYRKTGKLIGDVIRRGAIGEASLWTLSDADFWELLWNVADEDEKAVMVGLKEGGLPNEGGLSIPPFAKVRTIDPDVCAARWMDPSPLSELNEVWECEREDYIASREAIRALPSYEY